MLLENPDHVLCTVRTGSAKRGDGVANLSSLRFSFCFPNEVVPYSFG
jgi:hypothetical protein